MFAHFTNCCLVFISISLPFLIYLSFACYQSILVFSYLSPNYSMTSITKSNRKVQTYSEKIWKVSYFRIKRLLVIYEKIRRRPLNTFYEGAVQRKMRNQIEIRAFLSRQRETTVLPDGKLDKDIWTK